MSICPRGPKHYDPKSSHISDKILLLSLQLLNSTASKQPTDQRCALTHLPVVKSPTQSRPLLASAEILLSFLASLPKQNLSITMSNA